MPLATSLSSVFSVSSVPLWFDLFAEVSFPLGPGFYFNLFKLVPLLVVSLCWVRTCWWVNEDAAELDIPRSTWNPLLLGCGLAGLLVVWLLPVFWLSFLVLAGLYLTPSL